MIAGGGSKRPTSIEDLIDAGLMARLDRFDIRSRKMFPGKLQGERRSKRRGQSVEFEDFRNYVPGDDLRFIDWNVYARLERLFVKIFLEEEDLALHLAIDASASMDAGDPTKLEFAARAAMALGYVGLVKQNRVGVSVFGRPLREGRSGRAAFDRLPDVRGRVHVPRLASFLIDSIWGDRERSGQGGAGAPAPGSSFGEALATVARMRVGKGVMVVLSDFMTPEGYEGGLRALAAAGGYDTFCVQVLSPGEIEPEREAGGAITGDLRLTDVETGHGAEVTVTAPVIKRYKERLAEYCSGLESFCAAREMKHVLVRSDAPLDSFLLETMRRRGVLA